MPPRFRSWLFVLPFAAALLLGLWGMQDAPDRMPVHWGPDGQPDRWGTPFEALILSTLLLLPAPLILLLVEKTSRADRRNAPILHLVSFAFGLLALMMTAGLVFHWSANRTLLTGLGLLMTLLGNAMGRAQPSAFVGIRTPWVYLSRRAWHATQRRGGLWFTLYGLGLLLSGLFAPAALLTPWITPIGLIGGLLLIVLGVSISSYREYRRDPNPQPVSLKHHA